MSESGVDTDKKVGHELSKVLADTFTVYQKTHGYHWNVRGPNFPRPAPVAGRTV